MDVDCDNSSNSNCSGVKVDIIQPLSRDSVHRICSGQVVISLAVAVKELVENAIDAAATIIEIRLKDYGSELIEVSDNGSGVCKDNFQTLTLKHYTSKLRDFNDLEFVETLGFRGEALSSLSMLSKVSVTTRHVSADYATKIEYDSNGKITNESPAARDFGTTVALSNLFYSLPVRQKEFHKNLKREFNKMCHLLYAYCLVCKGIKFTCLNQTQSGSRSTVISTQGSDSIRDNVVNIFGAKQISSLIDVDLVFPNETIMTEYGLKLTPQEHLPFTFEFLVSSVAHGSGRSSCDRQFYFINNRPCELVKIMKLINMVYKQYNANQYPFVYLNINIERPCVDVNVTPDKRHLFFTNEKLILAVLKSSLLEAFMEISSTFKMQNIAITNPKRRREPSNVTQTLLSGFSRSSQISKDFSSNSKEQDTCFSKFKKHFKTDETDIKTTEKSPTKILLKELEETTLTKNKEIVGMAEMKVVSNENKNLNMLLNVASELNQNSSFNVNNDKEEKLAAHNDVTCSPVFLSPNEETNLSVTNCRKASANFSSTFNEAKENIRMSNEVRLPPVLIPPCNEEINLPTLHHNITTIVHHQNADKVLIKIKSDYTGDKKNITVCKKTNINLDVSIDKMKQALSNKRVTQKENDISVCFRSQIAPEANKNAEQELKKHISKDMFRKMDIIGQFNLGFIITKLENDLFIIDQHATDEKYNFEQLQQNFVVDSQVLVVPKQLELTITNENVLIENEEIFRKNGFTFVINHNAETTKRILLTSVPIFKNYTFGTSEIDEMLYMLQDASHTMCRPSKMSLLFASKACRKSVMIGNSLNHSDMRRLIDHMGEIDQPWNCPHGRPTMRHLINLKLLHQKEN